MKKRIGLMLLALVTLIGLFAISATADEAPTASIAGHNLSLNDNIYIIYYADFENVPAGAEKGVLVWTSQQESYEYGTQNAILPVYTGNNYGHDAYYFTGVAAKMMAQDVYAKAFVKDGDNITYGALDKYSVLQYCYNKKGSETLLKTGATKTLGELVTSMLNYGATAQEAMNYNTDRLANADFFEIKVVNGSLADTTNSGLFQANDTASLTAPATKNELPFEAWKNAGDTVVGNTPELQIKVTAADTFTATYVEFSTGLAFESNGDGTCSLTDRGTCTDSVLIVPKTSPAGDTVTSIMGGAFASDTTITGINLPETITEIGANAFKNSELKDVVFRGSLNDWVEIDIKSGNEKLTGANITYVKPHTHVEVTDEAVPATCTEPGLAKGSHCSICGEVLVPQETTDALGHTLLENGLCERCGDVIELVTSEGLEFETNGDGTCALVGKGTCNDTYVAVPKESPDGDIVTSIDNNVFKETGITIINLPNTIEEIGRNAFKDCADLEKVYFRGTQEEFDAIDIKAGNDAFLNAELILVHEHEFGEWIEETPATCVEEGEKAHYFCAGCEKNFDADYNELDDLTIPTAEHTLGDLIPEVAATCTEDGTKAHYQCSVCEKYFDEDYNEIDDLTIPTAEHTFGDLIAEVAATCTEDGTKAHYQCSVCEKYFDEDYNELADLTELTIPAAHTEVIDEAVPATCTETGLTEGKHCSVCEAPLVAQEEIPALGHNYGELVAEVAATCTEAGTKAHYHCSVCEKNFDAEKNELTDLAIAALGHTYGDLIAEVPATCAATGTKAHYHCSVCEKNFDAEKNELTDLAIAALEHTYGDWIAEVPATEGAAGTKGHYHCTACGKDFDADHNEIADLVIPKTAPTASQGLQFKSNGDGTCKLEGLGTCTDKNVVIPAKSPAGDTVTTIYQYAFFNNTNVESVVIPAGVTRIEANAFDGCTKLATVTMPAGVTYIGAYAFRNCSALQTFLFQGTKAQWTTLITETNMKRANWKENAGSKGSFKVQCTDGWLDQNLNAIQQAN